MSSDTNARLLACSYEYADKISHLLAVNNIQCSVSKIDDELASLNVSLGDLLEGARIIESALQLENVCDVGGDFSASRKLIIPVDYTDKSIKGCEVGFELARRLSCVPVIMHSYLLQDTEHPESILDPLGIDIAQFQENADIDKLQAEMMSKFVKKIKSLQAEGKIAPTKFENILCMGMPEESILEYSKKISPQFIVMATRSSHKRAKELVGSVTAEVLDSCRVPLFTIPEDYDFIGIREIRRICFFSNLDKQDTSSIETFLSRFDYPEIEVTLIPVTEKYGSSTSARLEKQLAYFSERYPSVNFKSKLIKAANFRADFKQFCDAEAIQLFVVQNKKKNIFKRLISPGIAHILFYERDLPMIIIPT